MFIYCDAGLYGCISKKHGVLIFKNTLFRTLATGAALREQGGSFAIRSAKLAFSKDMFKGVLGAGSVLGARQLREIITCRYNGQRMSPSLLLGIIGYLEGTLIIGSGQPIVQRRYR